jgi:hypothetical protein
MTRLTSALLLASFGMVVACGADSGIANATNPNVVDTFTVTSLEGGALQAPSAYSIASNNVVRTYETITFDFAYTVDPAGRHLFLPLAVLGLSPGTSLKPGLIKAATTFDATTEAPQNGYITTDTVVVDSGDVFVLRSTDICIDLGVPQYAKLQIIATDPAAKTLTFQALADNNCGYRGLNVGIPRE